jgi:lipoteichoic acid synthase
MPRSDERRIAEPPMRPRPRAERQLTGDPKGPVPDLFLLILIGLLIAKSALARGLAMSWSVALSGLWLEAGIAVLLISVPALAFRNRNHLLMLAIYGVYCILLFADAMYAGFFEQMLDPKMFGLVGQATEISDVIVGLVRPVYLWFFIDIPILAFWAVLLHRRHAVYQRTGATIAAGASLVIAIAQVIFACAVPPGTDSSSIAAEWGMTSMQLASLESMALPREKSAFARVSAAGRDSGTGSTADAVAVFNGQLGEFGPAGGRRIAPFPEGALKGKTVIIVQFESLERMFVNAKVAGQSVTPNVNRFVADSWDFPNTYSQTGIGNTADAEFTLATSMLPALQQNSTTAYADRELPALPRLLDSAGYETITLHTNDASFWFRKDLYKSLGYQKYYDKSYFKDRDQMWRGSSDEVLFEDGFKALKNHLKTKKPVLATFVTMTSHMEYMYPKEQSRRPLKLSPRLASSYAGMYASSISYADAAFGEFIEDLKRSGIYDKAVIVLIGDHMGYKKEDPASADTEILHDLLGRDRSYVDHQRVAFAIHVPGQQPKTVTSVRATQDITPSVADLLGVDLSRVPHFGRSAFVEGPRLIPMRAYFPGGSYIDNNIVFVAGATEGDDEAFDIQSKTQVTAPRRSESKVSLVRQFNALSDDWIMSQPTRKGAVSRRKSSGAGASESE